MTQVIILSKTHMNGQICVGGILLNGRYVRMLDINGHNQPENTSFDVRHIWEIDFVEKSNCIAPHVEDILVQKAEKKGTLKDEIKLSEFLMKQLKVNVWKGPPDNLFDGLLKWTNGGSGYIDSQAIPANSVGFWVSDIDLLRSDYKGVRYRYNSSLGWRNLKLVGFQNPVDSIPAGILMRVSLARWWQQDEFTEERCFLQLSGWYDMQMA